MIEIRSWIGMCNKSVDRGLRTGSSIVIFITLFMCYHFYESGLLISGS